MVLQGTPNWYPWYGIPHRVVLSDAHANAGTRQL